MATDLHTKKGEWRGTYNAVRRFDDVPRCIAPIPEPVLDSTPNKDGTHECILHINMVIPFFGKTEQERVAAERVLHRLQVSVNNKISASYIGSDGIERTVNPVDKD